MYRWRGGEGMRQQRASSALVNEQVAAMGNWSSTLFMTSEVYCRPHGMPASAPTPPLPPCVQAGHASDQEKPLV